MNTIRTITAILAISVLPVAFAQAPDHRLGDHPALIVKRLHDKQGYDYASKFYPHPACFFLREAPPPPTDRSCDKQPEADEGGVWWVVARSLVHTPPGN